MPEHLLTLRLEETDALETFRGSDPDDGHICDTCGMVFKTKAMTIYHKVAFCVGTPVSENMHSYDVERTSESINLVNLKSSGRGTDGNKHGDGDVSSDGKPKECQKVRVCSNTYQMTMMKPLTLQYLFWKIINVLSKYLKRLYFISVSKGKINEKQTKNGGAHSRKAIHMWKQYCITNENVSNIKFIELY